MTSDDRAEYAPMTAAELAETENMLATIPWELETEAEWYVRRLLATVRAWEANHGPDCVRPV